jgi:Luciferase-like monooxygenase
MRSGLFVPIFDALADPALVARLSAEQRKPDGTPLARRRPVTVARETATLDRLSGGRLTLGVGLGSDRSGNELRSQGRTR